ncbi:MAG: metallophosphoesterase [Candidatus Heimdallarchaeota archaeon]|nr:metallophosphoesterase [Candidatus Heimdallarchaeota archaeon]MBY8994376.1 metallophosphoesterase [Candidatus Heimdallarchaeota archaeon]
MRFLAIADTHLGYETGRTSQARKFVYERMFGVFEEIIEIAKREKVDYILHGGDIFNRSKPRRKVVTRAYKIIEQILTEDIGFVIAPGNHERSILPDTLLRFHPKSHFFSEFAVKDLEDCALIGFPYSNNISKLIDDKLSRVLKEFEHKPCLILCHQLFDGAEFGPQKFRFNINHGAIDPLLFPDSIKLIVSGHIHRAQSLMKGFVVYPGSTERTSFIEIIEPKGYLLIDLEEKQLQVEFKELPSIPMNVIEKNLTKHELDFNDLKQQIEGGMIRTLIRLTGRALTTDEVESIRNHFPEKQFPLLTINPRFPNQVLKPLYEENLLPFLVPGFSKSFKR